MTGTGRKKIVNEAAYRTCGVGAEEGGRRDKGCGKEQLGAGEDEHVKFQCYSSVKSTYSPGVSWKLPNSFCTWWT